jgi:urease accessory protein
MTTDARQLLLLLNWMSPAFPTGAFAYSHGLEWAVEAGIVKTREDVLQWIDDLLTRGSARNDAVIFARCWEDGHDSLNSLALALCSSRERWLETTQLGRAFGVAVETFLPSPAAARHPFLQGEKVNVVAYPVAAGTACAAMGIARDQALLAFLQGFAAALTSVAVRLVPLGQTAGLEVLRDLMPAIAATARRAEAASLDDLGSIALLSDIAAMKHESQHSRVFRT